MLFNEMLGGYHHSHFQFSKANGNSQIWILELKARLGFLYCLYKNVLLFLYSIVVATRVKIQVQKIIQYISNG